MKLFRLIVSITSLFAVSLSFIFFPNTTMLHAAEFNPHHIISDAEMFDGNGMSAREIQRFLELKASRLATYYMNTNDGGYKSVAQIIYEAGRDNQVNPRVLLVMLQKEQSLIEATHPTQKQIDWAMGYGVCDSCDLNDPALFEFKGFENQINMAASRLRWFHDNVHTYKQVGQTYIIDGQEVTPSNEATAALYNYTPHIHGNYVFWKLWQRWFLQYYPDGSLLQVAGEPGVWLIQYGLKRPIVSKSALYSRYDPSKIIVVDKSELNKYESGAPIKFPNYSLLRKSTGSIFLLVNDSLRHIDSMATFRAIGFNPQEVISVSDEDIALYKMGTPITIDSIYPVGALLQNNTTGGVYFVQEGVKHPLVSRDIMKINYPRYSVMQVSPAELEKYELGDPIRFPEGTLIKTPSAPVVYVVSEGMKRPILSGEVFNKLGYKWSNIHDVSQRSLDLLPIGPYIDLTFQGQE